MRPAGPVLRRLMRSGQTAALARQPVAARARRSMLMEELQETRREQQADELEAALPEGRLPPSIKARRPYAAVWLAGNACREVDQSGKA